MGGASKEREKERKRDGFKRLKEVATDVEVTTSVCQRRLTIRIFRYFYRSNVPVLLLPLLLLLLLASKRSSTLYISFNSLDTRCSRGISQAGSMLRDYDLTHDLLLLGL